MTLRPAEALGQAGRPAPVAKMSGLVCIANDGRTIVTGRSEVLGASRQARALLARAEAQEVLIARAVRAGVTVNLATRAKR